jgi:hypothetical protein
MTRSAWTGEDCIRLRAHIESGGSVARASVIFNRSISTIQVQARKQGTPFPDSRVVRRQWLTRYAEAERVTSLRTPARDTLRQPAAAEIDPSGPERADAKGKGSRFATLVPDDAAIAGERVS